MRGIGVAGSDGGEWLRMLDGLGEGGGTKVCCCGSDGSAGV